MREENTVINWKITTTEAIKWRRAKYEKTKHRKQQNGMNGGQAQKKHRKTHLQQRQEKRDNDYETKKEMTPEKNIRESVRKAGEKKSQKEH